MAESSFQKKRKKVVEIPGTKLSVHNSQLLVSSGINSLDNIIGGGLPVGSIIIIEEDAYRRYAGVMLQSFVAEGIASGQYVHIVSPNASQFMRTLPLQCSSSATTAPTISNEKMNIAWRYQQQNNTNFIAKPFSHKFNYSKKMNHEEVPQELISLESLNFSLDNVDMEKAIISSIKDTITKRMATNGSNSKANLLRIAISFEGLPLIKDTSRFLQILKSLVRYSYSIIMMSVPTNTTDKVLSEIKDISDFAIKLTANQDSIQEVNPLYKELDGILEINKVAAINTLMKPPYISQLGFKLLKTRFSLEKLHLPPDLSETVSRSNSKPMCNLEF